MKIAIYLLLITFALMGCCKSSNAGKVYVDKDLLSYLDVGKSGSKWIYESRGIQDTMIYIDKKSHFNTILIEEKGRRAGEEHCGIYQDFESFGIDYTGKISNIGIRATNKISINKYDNVLVKTYLDSLQTPYKIFRDSILTIKYYEYEYYFKKNVGLIAYNIDLDTNLYKLKELIL